MHNNTLLRKYYTWMARTPACDNVPSELVPVETTCEWYKWERERGFTSNQRK